jgi:membrane protein implicated in regulation of membrane protease activity
VSRRRRWRVAAAVLTAAMGGLGLFLHAVTPSLPHARAARMTSSQLAGYIAVNFTGDLLAEVAGLVILAWLTWLVLRRLLLQPGGKEPRR